MLTRTDDVINVAGYCLSTGRLEEVIACHADVAECAVVALDDCIKRQVPVAVVALNHRSNTYKEKLCLEIVQMVRG